MALETRIAGLQTNGRKLSGYAAVFGSRSLDLGGFVEVIEPTAFDESLASGEDILALFNHDSGMPLGRRSTGTLILKRDARGLGIEIDPPEDVSYAEDLKKLIARGDIKQMSFGFTVPPGGDSWKRDGTQVVRTLHKVNLAEVSAVAMPAYPATTIALRSLAEFKRRERAEWLLRHGVPDYRAIRLAYS